MRTLKIENLFCLFAVKGVLKSAIWGVSWNFICRNKKVNFKNQTCSGYEPTHEFSLYHNQSDYKGFILWTRIQKTIKWFKKLQNIIVRRIPYYQSVNMYSKEQSCYFPNNTNLFLYIYLIQMNPFMYNVVKWPNIL